jgi:urease accessory protein
MNATARLLKQRSVGHVHVRMEQDGIAVMREAGSAKCRVPWGATEAILINTSGGLAGGDQVDIKAEVGEAARLTLTSQAAERIYRTLGPAAEVRISLTVGRGATLFWMPQECIFFDGGSLDRSIEVDLAKGATFLAVEPMVFGRHEMGERIRRISVTDRWNVRQENKLTHADRFRLGPDWQDTQATFGGNYASASIVLVSPLVETLCDKLRSVVGKNDGVSAWNGKLVARLAAKDGFHLRKTLNQALSVCAGSDKLPKCWML